ncbi:hypothetical protein ACOME3_006881 [Neoechinorhynchus agilis]
MIMMQAIAIFVLFGVVKSLEFNSTNTDIALDPKLDVYRDVISRHLKTMGLEDVSSVAIESAKEQEMDERKELMVKYRADLKSGLPLKCEIMTQNEFGQDFNSSSFSGSCKTEVQSPLLSKVNPSYAIP